MRAKVEQQLIMLMLKGLRPGQAASAVIAEGRYIKPDDLAELEELIMKDFFAFVHHLDRVKHGHWPELFVYLKENSVNPNQQLNEVRAETKGEYLDALKFVQYYAYLQCKLK